MGERTGDRGGIAEDGQRRTLSAGTAAPASSAQEADRTMSTTTRIRPEREIRFAVVMYGGVSLAIYINGVAQELFQLSLATATPPGSGGVPQDPDPHGTAATYRMLARLLTMGPAQLRELEHRMTEGEAAVEELRKIAASGGDVGVRFVVDTISGTSAGGINGVFLGKALANNQDLRDLQDLWIRQGDIRKLINDDRSTDGVKGLRTQKPPRALLNGERMYVKLLEALGQMRIAGARDEPSAHVGELDVFLTTTDVRGLPVYLRLADGVAEEKRHRNVLQFRYRNYLDEPQASPRGWRNDFGAEHDTLLAFAARCTSSFPLAFEPMRIAALGALRNAVAGEHREALGKAAQDWQPFFPLYRRTRDMPGEPRGFDIGARPFCDGGYLDNKPFSYAIDALVSRLADVPVERKLIYVEPRPEEPAPERLAAPDALENVFLALTLSGYETIREDLERILDRNRLVERTLRLLEYIDRDFETLPPVDPRELETLYLQGGLEEMIRRFGTAYGGYHRLKVGALTDEIAGWIARAADFDPNSDHVLGIRLLVGAWRSGTFERDVATQRRREASPAATENQFLYRYDLSFRIRRLRFVLGRLARLRTLLREDMDEAVETELRATAARFRLDAPGPSVRGDRGTLQLGREALERLTAGLRKALIGLLTARRLLSRADTRNPLHAPLYDTASGGRLLALLQELLRHRSEEVRRNEAERALRDDAALARSFDRIADVLADCVGAAADESRRLCEMAFEPGADARHWPGLLVRLVHCHYDYYHHYDFLSFPVTYATDTGAELAPTEVIRISPRDATLLVDPRQGDERSKLAGTVLMNFGAFFQANWRRNDILWGRLDAAERLVATLLPEGHERLRRALTRDAQTRILRDHYAAADANEIARLVTTALDRPAGRTDEPTRLIDAGRMKAGEVAAAAGAMVRQSLGEHRLWQFFADRGGYEVDRNKEPHTWAEAMSRGSRVLGRLLESISTARGIGPGARLATWLTRVATALWGLVIVATPDSVWKLLTAHWLKLLTLLSVLLVGVGLVFDIERAQNAGWVLLALTLGLGTAWWIASDWLSGHVPRARTIALVIVLLLAGYGGYEVYGWFRTLLGQR
jgi:patatin-related protein